MEIKMIKCESCGKLTEDKHEDLRGWWEIRGQVTFRCKRARGPCKGWTASVPILGPTLDGHIAHFCSRKCLNVALECLNVAFDRIETGKEE